MTPDYSKYSSLVAVWRFINIPDDKLIQTILQTPLDAPTAPDASEDLALEYRIHLECLYHNAVHYLRYGFFQ